MLSNSVAMRDFTEWRKKILLDDDESVELSKAWRSAKTERVHNILSQTRRILLEAGGLAGIIVGPQVTRRDEKLRNASAPDPSARARPGPRRAAPAVASRSPRRTT